MSDDVASWRRVPQPLQEAFVEIETARRLWVSTEEQVATLIDATIRRIADESWPFYEDNEESILQRDETEAGMRRIARSTTVLQAWAIFESAALWAAEERRRLGHPIDAKRSSETFFAWAYRELLGSQLLLRDTNMYLETLCSLRNAIIHSNGQYAQMDAASRARVDRLVANDCGVAIVDGRIQISQSFVSGALLSVELALNKLSEPFREAGK